MSAEQLGLALVELLVRTVGSHEQKDAERILELKEKYPLIDHQRVYNEFQYLRALSVHYGIISALQSPLREAVMSTYSKWLHQAGQDMAQKGEVAGTIMYENFRSRLPVYDQAIREVTDNKSMLLKVGKVFAMYCGFENDLLIISYGYLELVMVQKMVKEYLDSLAQTYSFTNA
jgi:hypothetical protein